MPKIKITIEDLAIEEAADILNILRGPGVTLHTNDPITPSTQTQQYQNSFIAVADVDEGTVDASNDFVDAEGLPWDERIHSSNKKKTAKGVWARRRNVSDADYNAVVAQLKGSNTSHTVAPMESAPVPQPSFTPPPVMMPQMQMPPATMSVAPPMTVVPSLPPAPVNDLNTLIGRIQGGVAAGKLTITDLGAIVGNLNQRFGVQMVTITDVAGNQQLIDAAFAELIARGV